MIVAGHLGVTLAEPFLEQRHRVLFGGGDGTKAAMDANDYLEDVPERETAAEAEPAPAESDD